MLPPRTTRAVLRVLLLQALLLAPALAEIVVNDTWADGTRTNTNLPTESTWYESSSGNLIVVPGTMTATTASGSSRTWWTYFTPAGSSPVQLAVGESLKTTVVFTPNDVNTGNTKRGFSIGLYDFSGGTRTTATSGSPQGAGAAGYMVNVNFGRTIGVAGPLELRQRTTTSSSGLMDTSSAYTTLGTGGAALDADAFISGTEYTLEITATRVASGIELKATFSNAEGWSMSHTEMVTTAVVSRFDGFSLRATKTSETATSFAIARFKVERIPNGPLPPTIATHPQSQTVASGQPVTFTVSASGSDPLSYQWTKNNVNINGATAATLTLPAAQGGDAGAYRVVVTNPYNSVTSNPATLTVNVPTPPSITAHPQNVTINAGQSAGFSVTAAGSPPFTYQWFRNDQSIPGATDAALSIPNPQAANAGTYKVTVTNVASSVTSNPANLAVIPAAPTIVTPPASQAAGVGEAVTLTVVAAGTEPFTYQWRKNGSPINGQTGSQLYLSGVQESDSANYSVAVTNAVTTTVSADAMLTVTTGLSDSAYNLAGFAQATTGGGLLAETNANYKKVYTAADLHDALESDTVKVIEIMNDLNLGYDELPAATKTAPFRANATPLLHPVLLVTGVSLIDLADKTGLTIFSANGATIRHAEFNIKRCSNLIIRNLKFDELWEWDESSKGNYDRNDWDLVTVDMTSTNVWIDHCDFGKAYDGVVDIKGGSNNVTISWCRFLQDDGGPNSWVRQQINSLEANRSSNPMYDFLRTNGFSVDDIVSISRSQKKGHLVGATEFASTNASLSVTLHHNLYLGLQDRLPRLRAGNAHVYNVHLDNRDAYAASLVAAQRLAAMPSASATKLGTTYHFGVTQNASISTEGGAVLVEKSYYDGARYALRNNQADVSDPAYTGKIRAVDMIFKFGSTNFRGGTDTPGHPLGPVQATVIPFSFNGFTTLPYTYSMNEPDQVSDIITIGAGAGKLPWVKSNWLKTTYSGTSGPVGPSILTPPSSQTVGVGGTVNFSVAASGTPTLSYQWRKNGSPISNATNPSATTSTLSLSNVQLGDAGSYSVTVTNAQNNATSAPAILTVTKTFEWWRQQQFNTAELSNPAISGPEVALNLDGVPNRMRYALGIAARSAAATALPRMGTDTQGRPVFIFRKVATAGDLTYVVRVSGTLTSWSEQNVTLQRIATADSEGIEIWEARYTGPPLPAVFYRLVIN